MAQKNKKTAKKKKSIKNKVLGIILVLLLIVIVAESYLLFAKSNTLWPYENQSMTDQKDVESEKAKKTNAEKTEESAKTQDNSYNNANYKPEDTVTTDESINESGVDTTKQSTETQQDMNVLYGPEE